MDTQECADADFLHSTARRLDDAGALPSTAVRLHEIAGRVGRARYGPDAPPLTSDDDAG